MSPASPTSLLTLCLAVFRSTAFRRMAARGPFAGNGQLQRRAAVVMRNSIAPTTRASYNVGWRAWTAFAGSHQITGTLLRPSELDMIAFAIHLSIPKRGFPHGISGQTIDKYLAGVQHYCIANLAADPRKDRPALKAVLAGIHKTRGAAGANKPRPRQPVTVATAMACLPFLALDRHEHLLVWTVMCTALSGFFRLGELLPSQPERQLRWRDLTFVSESHVRVHLAFSKTDLKQQGVDVDLYGDGSAACPVRNLLALRAAAGHDDQPHALVFDGGDGVQVHRDRWFVHQMRQLLQLVEERWKVGLRPELFSGHSLRQGAATSAWLSGVPEAAIMALGRWRSRAYVRYVRIPAPTLRRFSSALLNMGSYTLTTEFARLATASPPAFFSD